MILKSNFLKKIILVLGFVIIHISNCFAAAYSEDNAAYWYMEAIRLLPSTNSTKMIYNVNNLKQYENVFKLEFDKYEKVITFLKKANDIEKCFFYIMPKYDGDETGISPDINLPVIQQKIFSLNNFAWYCISIGKPEYASVIWESIISISMNMAKDNSIFIRLTFAVTFVGTIKSLYSYLDNGASTEFKNHFVEVLKKYPKNIFDLNDVKKVHYNYQMQNYERFSKDIYSLARIFGYYKNRSKYRMVKNKLCIERLNLIYKRIQVYTVLLHLFIYGLNKYDDSTLRRILSSQMSLNYFGNENQVSLVLDEMYYPQIIKYMADTLFIFFDNAYICPDKGLRTLEVETTITENKMKHYTFVDCKYKVDCNCKGTEVEIKPNPNTEALEKAEKYKNSPTFESDLKEFKEFYEKLLATDFSKEMSKMELSAFERQYSKNQLLLYQSYRRVGFGTLLSSIKNAQKSLEDFLKKYATD